MLAVIKHPDHIEVNIEPHVVALVANDPEGCFKQHLQAMLKKFSDEYHRIEQFNIKLENNNAS